MLKALLITVILEPDEAASLVALVGCIFTRTIVHTMLPYYPTTLRPYYPARYRRIDGMDTLTGFV